jgi:hypothetical protein
VLHKRRIKKLKRERNRGAHCWEVTQAVLDAWARAAACAAFSKMRPCARANCAPQTRLAQLAQLAQLAHMAQTRTSGRLEDGETRRGGRGSVISSNNLQPRNRPTE